MESNVPGFPDGPVLSQVLMVEDDPQLRHRVVEYLKSQNLAPTGVASLADARALLKQHRFDAVVLDLNLGSEDGLDLARELAAVKGPPVLIVSGRSEETDRIVGLELGADDYLSKPFSFRELAARIRSVLRRTSAPRRSVARRRIARFDRWRVDLGAHIAEDSAGARVELTVGELAVLRSFLDHPHKVLWRHELLALTRRDDAAVFPRTIDVLVARLRRKLERAPRRPELIRTVRGEGYCFEQAVDWEILPP